MINIEIEQTKHRKNFYRDLYRKELIILMILLISQLVMVGLIMMVSTHRGLPEFYASSSDGILSPLKPMPAPNKGDQPLLA